MPDDGERIWKGFYKTISEKMPGKIKIPTMRDFIKTFNGDLITQHDDNESDWKIDGFSFESEEDYVVFKLTIE